MILLLDSSESSAQCCISDTARELSEMDREDSYALWVDAIHAESASVVSLLEHSFRLSHLQ